MKVLACKKCGRSPSAFKTKSGGNGIRCDKGCAEYSHPTFTQEQMQRIWNYRMSWGEA